MEGLCDVMVATSATFIKVKCTAKVSHMLTHCAFPQITPSYIPLEFHKVKHTFSILTTLQLQIIKSVLITSHLSFSSRSFSFSLLLPIISLLNLHVMY